MQRTMGLALLGAMLAAPIAAQDDETWESETLRASGCGLWWCVDTTVYGYYTTPSLGELSGQAPHTVGGGEWSVVICDFGAPLLPTPIRLAGFDWWIDPNGSHWALCFDDTAVNRSWNFTMPIPIQFLAQGIGSAWFHAQGIAFDAGGNVTFVTDAVRAWWPATR